MANTNKKKNIKKSGTKKKSNTSQKKNATVKKAKPDNKAKAFWVSISMVLLTLLSTVFCYFPSDSNGFFGEAVKNVLLGLFSTSTFLLPLILLGLTIYIFKTKDTGKFTKKTIYSFITYILVGAFLQLLSSKETTIFELYERGILCRGGGLLGGALGLGLYKLIGTAASIIVVLFLILILLSVIFKVSFIELIKSFWGDVKDEVSDAVTPDSESETQKTITSGESSKERKIKPKPQSASSLDFDVDDKDKQKEESKKEDVSISEEELQKRIDDLIFENQEIPVAKLPKFKDEKHEQVTLTDSEEKPENSSDKDVPVSEENADEKKEKPEKVEAISKTEKRKINKEINHAIDTPYKNYQFPSIELLNKAKETSMDKRREMSETAKKLMSILKDFGVDAKLQQVTQGPTVTRYEIQPSTGIKLSKIAGLSEDIALNLAVSTVLVAPVPGKAAVGIEVPNSSVNSVSVRELLESSDYVNGKSKLTVAFGKDIGGNVVVGDIAKMPHVLIAGSTGSGKSVCINTIIVSLLYKARPDEVKLIMVDPKVVELSVYNGIPHLLIPVVTDPKRAAGALNWAVSEMMRRYSLFAQTATRNLEGYNNLMRKNGEETVPQIVIIIDELADLMMVAAKEVEEYICRLAQLARAAGIHLIIATQRPSVDVITGLIKANVPSRIAFAVSSQVDSRTILDKGGAEKLLGKGDMLYHPAGLSSAKRVQGAFVSDDEITAVTDFIKSKYEDSHYSEDLAEHIDNIANGEYGVTKDEDKDDSDVLLHDAISLALELGQISTAMIQRRLKVGYSRAGRIIDQMESRGLISGPNGAKPRDVYSDRIRALEGESHLNAPEPEDEIIEEFDESDDIEE